MDIDKAFDELQSAADADPEQVRAARERRNKFRDAFSAEEDVDEVFPSGSLARSTQRDPINDVDLIVLFGRTEHPEWGDPGPSAEAALKRLQKRVKALLGESEGEHDQIVRRADARNHAVKCFLDDPDDPDGFTVDVVPALRHNGHLLIPEKANSTWIDTDPEHLIEQVNRQQSRWNQFRPLVRVLKMWNKVANVGLKSLTVEVLALNHLPAESNRPRALYRFFTAVETAIERPIEDPAGLCGPIQPDLDVGKAKDRITYAASRAWRAVDAQDAGETDKAACLWREVFGDAFPKPECGCNDASEPEAKQPVGHGVGTAAATGTIGIDRPRPIRDAPQG